MKIKSLMMQALIVGLLPVSVNAQQKATIDWYGFVAAQSWINTHESVAGAEGFLYLYPTDRLENLVDQHDERAIPQGSWFGTMARLGFVLHGPQIFGAASRAKAELEFMNDLFPSTVGIAIGSPFNALNRSPQLRYEYFLGSDKNIKLTGAAIFQAANGSYGYTTAGKSYNYNRWSLMPMFYAGVDFTFGDFKVGGGVEYKRTTPTIDYTDGNKKYYVDGLCGMIQAQYNKNKLAVKAKTLIGHDMSHLGICSGFGQVDHLNAGDIRFAPLAASSSWAQIQWGGDLKFGLMGGFMSNWGAGKDLIPGTIRAAEGGTIDNMWRVAPNVQYTVGNMNLGVEYELTTVAYGTTIEPNGTVSDTHNVSNNRLLLSVLYAF